MKINFIVATLFIALLASSCGNKSDKKVEGSTVEAKVPEGPTTLIKFEEEDYNFGKVTQGQVVEHSFEFTNIGKEPLIISECHASCGCTVPEWPKDPIAPGQKSKITTKFNTAGKSNDQKKVVTVTANTEPFETYISISGFVEVPPSKEQSK
ncbi:MAG: DUF1573 domain-containing protein [Saprospiraceae bacterium]